MSSNEKVARQIVVEWSELDPNVTDKELNKEVWNADILIHFITLALNTKDDEVNFYRAGCERLREALHFYAFGRHYDIDETSSGNLRKFLLDEGERAAEALAAHKQALKRKGLE